MTPHYKAGKYSWESQHAELSTKNSLSAPLLECTARGPSWPGPERVCGTSWWGPSEGGGGLVMVVVKEEGAMQNGSPWARTPCWAHGHPREAVIPGIRGLNSRVTSHALLKPANKVDCNTTKLNQNLIESGIHIIVITWVKNRSVGVSILMSCPAAGGRKTSFSVGWAGHPWLHYMIERNCVQSQLYTYSCHPLQRKPWSGKWTHTDPESEKIKIVLKKSSRLCRTTKQLVQTHTHKSLY